MSIEIQKDKPTKFYIVLHCFKGAIVGVEQKFFLEKENAEKYINWLFENDPGLSYKDSFYLKEIVIGD